MYKKSVANWFANEDNLRQFCVECAVMTDENYHTERQILIAHKFGFKEFERKFKNIDAIHTDAGCLFPDLSAWRWQLAVEMSKEIARLYGQTLADKINLA